MTCLTALSHICIYLGLGFSSVYSRVSHGKENGWNSLWIIEIAVLVLGFLVQVFLPVFFDPSVKENRTRAQLRKTRTVFLLTVPSLVMLIAICLHLQKLA